MRTLLLCLVLLLTTACGREIDLSNLAFPDAAVGEADSEPAESIACSRFYHCVLGKGASAAAFAACEAQVAPEEQAALDMLEACREKDCGSGKLDPNAVGFEDEGVVPCLLQKCPERVVECAAGQGEDTCWSYVVAVAALEGRTSLCKAEPSSLCHMEFIEKVSEAEEQTLTGYLTCAAQHPKGDPLYETECLMGQGCHAR